MDVAALQLIQLVIFAVLAGVVLYQLYAVLGRRVGRQPEDAAAAPAPLNAPALGGPRDLIEDADGLSGLAALRQRDPSFEAGRFLDGARGAYEMVVRAFGAGDRDILKNLLSPKVLESFEAAIAAREAEGRSEQIEFLTPPRADIEAVDVKGDTAEVTVRFLAEFRSRSKGPEGEAVDDKRTAELWTFQRNLKSRDPNWTLAHVDAAEA
jgi:predicted lipid-binding transport protein (Tim44 family)